MTVDGYQLPSYLPPQLQEKLSKLQPSKPPTVVPPPPDLGPKPGGFSTSTKSPGSGPKPIGSSVSKPSSNASPKASPSSSPFLGGKFPQLKHVEKKQGTVLYICASSRVETIQLKLSQ